MAFNIYTLHALSVLTILCIFGLHNTRIVAEAVRDEANWKSIDSRPLPAWYDEAKVGIFLTLGLYSVPSLRDEWFWEYWKDKKDPVIVEYMKDNYKPSFSYQGFAKEFTAELFNPEEWADIFKASGAK